MTLSVTQPSAAVFRYIRLLAQQIPMVSKRLSLTETSAQNLTERAKSLLHTSKQKGLNCHVVTVTMSDMNTVQKIKKDKIFDENLILQWQTKKWPNFTKWPYAFFVASVVKNGQNFRNWPWNGQSGNSVLLYYQSNNCQIATHALPYCLWRNKQNSFDNVIRMDDLMKN